MLEELGEDAKREGLAQTPARYARSTPWATSPRSAAGLYPFVAPIRSQALWLAEHLARRSDAPWRAPAFAPAVKIHGWSPADIQRHDVAVRG